MEKNIFRKSIFRTTLAAVALSLVISLAPNERPAKAWDAIQAAILKQALEEAFINIRGTIMGAAKKQAARLINNEINRLVGGSTTGSARYITDWKDTLVTQPKNNAVTYMNDYISQSLSGRGSSSYSASGSGINSSILQQAAQDVITGISSTEAVGPSYEGSSDMFSDGNFYNFNSFLSDQNNIPAIYLDNVAAVYQQKLEEEKEAAKTQAIAYQGFKGTSSSNGKVMYPGSLLMQNMANAQDIGNKIIASAQNLPEVISAVVTQMINQSIENGIGQVADTVDQQAAKVTNQAKSSLDSAVSKYGPGALYK